ncbi:arginine N-succinyltransferase [Vibrio gangliei]|uniref:arginine N-succinyltransferase n=1 Tax=Vibrio gangliei TaxID=2077090 RepID=UPI000D01CFC9|nr:arginine N-succinyltransferase [Vibrio gangliei]
MMIIRPVTMDDRDAIIELAEKTGVGFTSLRPDEKRVQDRLERVLNTWRQKASLEEQGYLFVLEDTETKKVVGLSGIEVAIGLDEPWYNYRVGNIVHASKELSVYRSMPALFLSHDHTGFSELCTLFLDPDYRHSQNGYLLSKARFLFMANFPDRFSDRLIAEMRGFSDENGRSPFWESLGRHFFNMDFAQADHLSGTGKKTFIAELMPKHPMYVEFLTQEAQDVIGKVHPQTEPAAAILNSEGMKYENSVDIFDAGPTLEARVEDIRAVKDSSLWPVSILPDSSASENEQDSDSPVYLLANQDYLNYRSVLAKVAFEQDQIKILPEIAEALGVKEGDVIRAVTLFPEEKA